MIIARHSATADAAYNDLVRELMDEAVSDIQGTPVRMKRNGRVYWYDTFRVGTAVRKRYIGEDNDDMRRRIEEHKILSESRKERRSNRARLVRILRAERFGSAGAPVGSLLSTLARAGLFRLGGTVAGTHAFRSYEGELGIRLGLDELAQTGDLDIASFERLSIALAETESAPIASVLKDFEFDPVPDLAPNKVWRWRQTNGPLLVEFLTPSFEEDEGLKLLPALGVDAQALHHLNYLIADPIPAAVLYRDGILIQVPRPERFAVHKLIVADRRHGTSAMKARKDRRQAEFLIEVLAEDRPDDLREAYEDAMARGPKWRERLERSLSRSPEAADRVSAIISQ